jgi:hypothetical protein
LPKLLSFIVAIGFVLLSAGCRPAAMSYQLRRQGLDPVLFPPMRTGTSAASSTSDFNATIKNARKQPFSTAGCDVEGALFSLHWRGTTAQISLKSQSYFAENADQAPMQLDRGLYIDPLLDLEKFRANLLDRQEKGCLRSMENAHLRRAITESVPLPPVVAYFFQLGSYDVTGFFDLTTDFRVQVVSPIYPDGAIPSPERLMGYETAYYVFESRGKDDRIRLSLASATEVLLGQAAIEKHTLRNELAFSKSSGYFRLLFMADESSTNHVTRAILLSAPGENKLAEATNLRQIGPENYCRTLSIPNVTCTTFPRNFGVTPELRVRVNGKDAFIRVGGMIQEVPGLDDPDSAARKTVKIHRPFRGHLIPVKFDPASEDILKLVVLPGDQIDW